MATISIVRKHTLSHKKAKAAAEKIAKDLEKRFELAWEWSGDARNPIRNVEELTFDNVHLAVRSYK